jgi:hypothetical protein
MVVNMTIRIDNITYVNFHDKPAKKQNKYMKPKQDINSTLTETKLERLQSSIQRINKLCEELRMGINPNEHKG